MMSTHPRKKTTDQVDRVDNWIVRWLRIGLFAFFLLVVILAGVALAEAGMVAWATLGIVFGAVCVVALLVLLVLFLMS